MMRSGAAAATAAAGAVAAGGKGEERQAVRQSWGGREWQQDVERGDDGDGDGGGN